MQLVVVRLVCEPNCRATHCWTDALRLGRFDLIFGNRRNMRDEQDGEGCCMIEIVPIIDEDCFEIALETMFPLAQSERLAAEASWLCPDHLDTTFARVRLGMKSWLIQTGRHNILVDTCIGQHKERPRHAAWHNRASDRYLRNLAKVGLSPNDIDFVLCTHLHADHVGWNTRMENGRWAPTFPRARYAMSRRELDDWLSVAAGSDEPVNHGALEDSILPVVDSRMAHFVGAGEELVPGASIISLPGHTLDHFGLQLKRNTCDALFCGDAIHSPLQLCFPEWSSAFCDDAATAAATRIAMLGRAVDEGLELYPAHFRGNGSLRIRRVDNGFRPV